MLASLVYVPAGCFSPNAATEESTGRVDASSSSSGPSGDSTASGGDGSGVGSTDDVAESGSGQATVTSSSVDSSSSGEAGSTGSAGSGLECGDGVVEGDEECDEGRLNGVGSECTEECSQNVCGDGLLAADEVCDNGSDNGTGDGECAPDCSTFVTTKVIRLNILNSTNMDGNMGGANAPTVLDMGCADSGLPGYRAMFADGVARRASTTPNSGDGQIDWVLRPWTRYTNSLGGVVWTTDSAALLGVEDGASVALLAPIDGSGGFGVGSVVTGMNEDWVSHDGNTCNENSSSSPANFRASADPSATVNGGFLDDNAGAVNCSISLKYYCVEQ